MLIEWNPSTVVASIIFTNKIKTSSVSSVIEQDPSSVISEHHIEINCKSWNRSRLRKKDVYHDNNEEIYPQVFTTINGYLQTLSAESILNIETWYYNAYLCINTSSEDLTLVNVTLQKYISHILQEINLEAFTMWCSAHGNLNTEIGRKDVMEEKDSMDTTYLTEDYLRIISLCCILKLIMPLFAQYWITYQKLIGEEDVILTLLEVLECDEIIYNPVYIKLKVYINATIRKKIFGTHIGASEDSEILRNILALVLWKKLIIFDPKSNRHSIVKDIANFTKEKIEFYIKSGPRAKSTLSADGEPQDVAETYKVTAKYAPSVMAELMTYIPYIRVALDERISEVEVNDIIQNLLGLDIKPYHLIIAGMCTNKLIGAKSVELLPFGELINIVSICSLYLTYNDFPVLGELMRTECVARDYFITAVNTNRAQISADKALYTRLEEVYSMYGNISPALTMIDMIVRDVSRYNWDLQCGDISLLTNELFRLTIKLGE